MGEIFCIVQQELKVLHAADITDEYKLKHIGYIQDMRNELEQEDLIKNINSLSSGGLYAYDKVTSRSCDQCVSYVICLYDHVILYVVMGL